MKKILGTMAVFIYANVLYSQTLRTDHVKHDSTKHRIDSVQHFLQPLEVKAIRASDKTPFTKSDISKTEIAQVNFGQDLPFVLNQMPSVVVNSDAGNGVGYTGIRIRGTDATRINVTLNGIPFNDPESQSAYFVDMPDIVSSAHSIQVQRGVGTSTNGAGAFGGTINLNTNEINEQAYAESDNSYGSFNTWKNTVKFGSGIINDHFTIDARLSRIISDGYIDRASSNLQSMYFSGAYLNKNTSLRFNFISGKEKTYQAWYGVPQDTLPVHRTYNPAGTEKPGEPYDNQTDNYQQDHYQLFFNQKLNNNWSLNLTSFLIRGKGYYEEYKADRKFVDYNLPNVIIGVDTIKKTDLVRRKWLDNYFYGQIFSLQKKILKSEWTLGGAWTRYDGGHYGKLIWGEIGIPINYEYYNHPAYKNDMNVYAKWLYEWTPLINLFADVQYRYVKNDMNGFEDNPTLYINRKFNFINPKAGITYRKNNWQAYVSYALANKEPNRDDFEASATQQPTKEMLHDIEMSVARKGKVFSWNATAYFMKYKDQLVLTGEINDIGSYTRVNVPNSYRAGIELQGDLTLSKWMNIQGNVTVSRNKIKSFTEYLDDYDANYEWVKQNPVVHENTDISFSPSVIAGGSINLIPIKNVGISLLSKYVGNQYLDNTQNDARKINSYYVQDVRCGWTIHNLLFKEWNIIAQVNNVFNKKCEANGYSAAYMVNGVTVNDNYYMPMAGRNFVVSLNVKL